MLKILLATIEKSTLTWEHKNKDWPSLFDVAWTTLEFYSNIVHDWFYRCYGAWGNTFCTSLKRNRLQKSDLELNIWLLSLHLIVTWLYQISCFSNISLAPARNTSQNIISLYISFTDFAKQVKPFLFKVIYPTKLSVSFFKIFSLSWCLAVGLLSQFHKILHCRNQFDVFLVSTWSAAPCCQTLTGISNDTRYIIKSSLNVTKASDYNVIQNFEAEKS